VAPVGSLPVGSRRHATMLAVRGDQIQPLTVGWKTSAGWMVAAAWDGGRWRLRATWEAVGASDAPLPPPDLAVAGSNSGVMVTH
jgi:hypothetical protein